MPFVLGSLLGCSTPVAPVAPVLEVRLDFPPRTTLLNLALMADRLKPGTLSIADPRALAAHPLSVRCDREVTPDAVWLAMEVALRVNGWSLEVDGPTARPVATPELWFRGDRAVELVVVDGGAVEPMKRQFPPTEPDDPGDVVVGWSGDTLILGGPAESVGALRHAVDLLSATPDLVGSDGFLFCLRSVGLDALPARSTDGTTVRLTFPEPTSLPTATLFFCDLRRFAVAVPDVGALERDTVTLRANLDLSPEAAFRAYEQMLAVRGWSIRLRTPIAELVRTEPRVAGHEAAVVEVLAVAEVDEAVAAGRTVAGALVDPLPDPGRVVIGGSESTVAAARARITALETAR